ncbi:MAG: TonB-dependent receptor [Rikenellaceae bacterium]|nr:TonB-dependent receptor [Rikenellaceae bacterium]
MKQNYSLTERKRWLTPPPLKLFILLSVFCIAICPKLQAQDKTRTIKGRVIDAVTKEPIIGANIWLKETSVGRISGTDGSYTIETSDPNAVLVCSFLGYNEVEEAIGNRKEINFTLTPSSETVDEVVVVGYGTQRKESVIGAISSVKGTDLKLPTAHIGSSLAGQVNGVVAIQRSGEPGSHAEFWIRGINTISGNRTPLVLVDGIERSLDQVDAEDIESFSVLKDATATAVYGVRGANGVVLITTRSGDKGAPVVSVRAEMGVVSPTRLPKLVNSLQFAELYNEGYAALNNGKPFYTPEAIQKYSSGSDPDLYPNVDWIDELFKSVSYNERVSVNVSGGGSVARYYVSGSFYNENSIYRTDNMKSYNTSINYNKFSFRSNLDVNLSPTTILNVNLANIYETKVLPGGDGIWYNAFVTSPNAYPVRYSDGTLSAPDSGGSGANPYNLLTQFGYRDRLWNTAQALTGIKQDFGKLVTKGLTGQVKFSWDAANSHSLNYIGSPNTFYASGRDDQGNLIYKEISKGTNNLAYSRDAGGSKTFYLEASLNYDRTFRDKHRVGALFLYNQKSMRYVFAGNAEGSLPYRNQGIAGRFTYSYDDRYFIEGNFGYNGSENFSPGKRFGFFPAGALGWVISNEKFFDGLRGTINLLKLRGSYGVVGNDNIGAGRRFIYNGTFVGTGGYAFGSSWREYGGIRVGEVANDHVSWEKSYKLDLGIELNMFNGLKIQADYFRDHRKGIFLLRDDLSLTAGIITLPYVNVGEVLNRGFDGEIEYMKQFNENLSVSVRGNFTYNRNKVINDAKPRWNYDYRDMKGRPLDQQVGYIADGLFVSEEEIANSPEHTFGPVRVGDIKYRDLNGDGVINKNDQTSIGYTWLPEISYGFGASVRWKNLDVSVLFQGVSHVTMMLSGQAFWPFSSNNMQTAGFFEDVYDNIWREKNPDPNATYPRISTTKNENNQQASTYWQRDASYLRLKNFTVGYTIPRRLTRKIGIDPIRIYVSAINPVTFSKFKVFDPELAGGQGDGYPPTRIFSFGLNFNF